jgi:hypothetical protein
MQSNLLANVSLQQLKQAVVIREKIEDLEKELSRIIGGGLPGVKKAAPASRRMMSASARAKISAAMKARWARKEGHQRKSRLATGKTKKPRGQLKERIIQALKTAGKPGVKVKDLASKLGTSYGNVNVWLRTTAKGVKEIKKVAPGRFAWAP